MVDKTLIQRNRNYIFVILNIQQQMLLVLQVKLAVFGSSSYRLSPGYESPRGPVHTSIVASSFSKVKDIIPDLGSSLSAYRAAV